jgi:ABC-type dipeptide/oligopeptide/nickel transport system permease subunit
MATPPRTAEILWDNGRRGSAKDDDASLATGRALSPRWLALRRRFTPSLWIGSGIVILLLLSALLAPALSQYPPDLVTGEARLQAPSAAHPFGTDALGRDMFSRVLYGARLAVEMAMLGVVIAGSIGVTMGLLAGYYGGWWDQLLSRVMEVWMAFPSLLLAIIIVARLGPSLQNAIVALGIVGAPSFYRLTRGCTLSERQAVYVEAARAVGANDRRVLLRHILPNIAPSLVVLVTMRLGMLVLAGGGLSFIGLGAQPPQPEWGALLAAGRDYMDTAPWLALYPGLCITLTVAGFNLFGDGLRDILDPRRRNGPK